MTVAVSRVSINVTEHLLIVTVGRMSMAVVSSLTIEATASPYPVLKKQAFLHHRYGLVTL